MRHEESMEIAGLGDRETEQEFDLAGGQGVWLVYALVANGEIAFMRLAARECALLIQLLEKSPHLRLGSLPRRRVFGLEQQPARATLDARGDEQSETSRRKIFPVRRPRITCRKSTRAHARWPTRAHGEQSIDARLHQSRALRVGNGDGRTQAGTQHSVFVFRRHP